MTKVNAKMAKLNYEVEVGDVHCRAASLEELRWLSWMFPKAYRFLLENNWEVAVRVDENGFLVDTFMHAFFREIDKANKKLAKQGRSRLWVFLDYNTEAV